MGELQLRITAQAARDLQEIVAYIARDNPAAAERFGLALVEKSC
jgi:plasmid stabilization system protein ParE